MTNDREREFTEAADQWTRQVLERFRQASELQELLSDVDTDDIDMDDQDNESTARLLELLDLFNIDADDIDTDRRRDEIRDEIREEMSGYGLSVRTVVRIELMGGGPAGWIELETDEERRQWLGGRIAYQDWFMPARTRELDTSEVDAIAAVMWLDDPASIIGE